MANPQHVEMLLRDGVAAWNRWRSENPGIRPDLSQAILERGYLRNANLNEADLSEANLHGANVSGANLSQADLNKANLSSANLGGANLHEADLRGAILTMAYLPNANLSGANLSYAYLLLANLNWATFNRANLRSANLTGVNCLQTDFSHATLTGCIVYGMSGWDLNLEGAIQGELRISPVHETVITVDNLEVAQFLYLMLHNQNMRAILDTITSKVVLILGRFSSERKPVLDALREALRNHPNGYIPVLFDFDAQTEKPVFDTVKTLANLARFVIADLTDPNMVRSELSYITANVPSVPIQPLIQEGAKLPVEYETWVLYRSFLPLYSYADLSHLLANLTESVITPVEAHVQARRL